MSYAGVGLDITGAAAFRWFDTINQRDTLVPLTKAVAGLIAYVHSERAFYIVRPSETTPNTFVWSIIGQGVLDLGQSGEIATLLGGLRVASVGAGNNAGWNVSDGELAITFQATLTQVCIVTLPAPNAANPGRVLIIKSKNAVNGVNTIKVSGVDGGTKTIGTAYGALVLMDDGTSWGVVSEYV